MTLDPDEWETSSLALQSVARLSPAVGGLALLEYAPAGSELGALGALALLGGLMLAGEYVGATVGRLSLWWHTREYEVKR